MGFFLALIALNSLGDCSNDSPPWWVHERWISKAFCHGNEFTSSDTLKASAEPMKRDDLHFECCALIQTWFLNVSMLQTWLHGEKYVYSNKVCASSPSSFIHNRVAVAVAFAAFYRKKLISFGISWACMRVCCCFNSTSLRLFAITFSVQWRE